MDKFNNTTGVRLQRVPTKISNQIIAFATRFIIKIGSPSHSLSQAKLNTRASASLQAHTTSVFKYFFLKETRNQAIIIMFFIKKYKMLFIWIQA